MESASNRAKSDIIEILTEKNPELFNGIPAGKKREMVRTINQVVYQSHSGPLPTRKMLEQYDKILPNGAECLRLLVENEQAFRHKHTENIANRALNQQSAGQWLAFLLSILGLGGDIYLAVIGKETAGITSLIASLAILSGAFYFKKFIENSTKKE